MSRLKKYIALIGAAALATGVIGVAATSASATGGGYQEVTVTWLLPDTYTTVDQAIADVGTAAEFPQTRLEGPVPCGRVAQEDVYNITPGNGRVALYESLGDTLEWINGHPEDSLIYVSHRFIAGEACEEPEPEPVVTMSGQCALVEGTPTYTYEISESAVVDATYEIFDDTKTGERGLLPGGESIFWTTLDNEILVSINDGASQTVTPTACETPPPTTPPVNPPVTPKPPAPVVPKAVQTD